MNKKERIKKYNKEYFARPEVVARAKVRNAQRRHKRKAYKQTEAGKRANAKYLAKPEVRERRKESRLRLRYGMTLGDYRELYKEQGGKCAICGTPKDKFDIDHCHKTDRVRGLLCGACNRALGLMKDNTVFLLKAIKYLE